MKKACIAHDVANLVCLPVLCSVAVAGLCGKVDPTVFAWLIFSYVAVDTVWILLQPDAVPSALAAIRVHHFVTLLLCLFPLLRPEVAIFACLDGLTEINTFFLIARRQWKSQRKVLTALYWATFIPVRLALFPYLLVVFATNLPPSIPAWERTTIWCCQLFLCIFNVGMVHRSLSGWWRQQQAAAKQAAVQQQQQQLPASVAAQGRPAATATAHVVLSSGGSAKEKYGGVAGTGNVAMRRRSHGLVA